MRLRGACCVPGSFDVSPPNNSHHRSPNMNRFFAIAILVWAALNFIGTLMPLPDELQFFSKSSNFVRWTALCLVLVALAILKYPRQCSWNGIKNLLHVCISWERGDWYFLGMTGSPNPADTRITGFQLRGFNNSKQPLKSMRGHLVLSNGEEMPLRITTFDPRMDNASRIDVGSRTTIYVNGQFGSLTVADFLSRYAPFSLVLEWSNGRMLRNFSYRQIQRQISRFQNDSSPKPDTY
jgi:hypothetical protein